MPDFSPSKKIHSIKTFGNSMYPVLLDGDVVNLKKVSLKNLKVDDFVTFKKDKKLVTHRVIYKTPGYIITKGDNNPLPDGKIYQRNLLGKVSSVRRGNQEISPKEIYLFQSTLYWQEILKVKKAFEEASIEFVFLKGLPLHLFFEGKNPKRIYADCDVLINSAQFAKVTKLLKGFDYIKENFTYSRTQRKLKDKVSEISFYKTINGFRVIFDIHLEAVFLMTQIGKLEPLYKEADISSLSESFLKERRWVSINQEKFPILSTENLVIYLALHLFHHNFRGYYRYHFLDQIIKKKKINFEFIYQKIIKYQLNNFTYFVFSLLKSNYKTPVPESFMKAVAKNTDKNLSTKVKNINIFEDEERVSGAVMRFKNIFYFSHSPIYRKLLIFLNKQIIYSLYWVTRRKLVLLARNKNLLFK